MIYGCFWRRKLVYSHFGSLREHAIRNVERCEIGYPQRCLQPREACEQSPWNCRLEIPHKQAHKARTYACSLCFAE